MAEPIVLRGMTWDHSRGYDPMVATSRAFSRERPDVAIHWEKRSLQAFADKPIGEMVHRYDLMVIDHPHVGEASRAGHLLALDGRGYDEALEDLATHAVGLSHRSYGFDGRQWALAIDAATPVAAYRPDRLDVAPSRWEDVMALARQGAVGFALKPINALMMFFGLARNRDFAVAEAPDLLIARDEGLEILDRMREVVALVDRRCLEMDPIGIYEWMGGQGDAPVYSPFGYGYSNYSREGYRPFPLVFADAPGFGDNGPRGTVLGGTGIAVSAQTRHPEVAVDYAFRVAGEEWQRGIFFEAGGQPGHARAWEDPALNGATHNFFANTRKTLETAWLRPGYDGYMRLQNAGGNVVHACLLGQISEKQALDQLDTTYRESFR